MVDQHRLQSISIPLLLHVPPTLTVDYIFITSITSPATLAAWVLLTFAADVIFPPQIDRTRSPLGIVLSSVPEGTACCRPYLTTVGPATWHTVCSGSRREPFKAGGALFQMNCANDNIDICVTIANKGKSHNSGHNNGNGDDNGDEVGSLKRLHQRACSPPLLRLPLSLSLRFNNFMLFKSSSQNGGPIPRQSPSIPTAIVGLI